MAFKRKAGRSVHHKGPKKIKNDMDMYGAMITEAEAQDNNIKKRPNATLKNQTKAKPPTKEPPLPFEMLLEVCSHLDDPENVKNFRLASKTLANVGEEFLVQNLNFFMHPSSLMKMEEIAVNPQWSRHVHTLTFENVVPKEWDEISPVRPYTKKRNHAMWKPATTVEHDNVARRYAAFTEAHGEWLIGNAELLHTKVYPLIREFTGLKALKVHQGFQKPRPCGKMVDAPMTEILDPIASTDDFNDDIWDIRGRIFRAPERDEDNRYEHGMMEIMASFYDMMQSCFKNEERNFMRLDTVVWDSYVSGILGYWKHQPTYLLPAGSRLKHLTIRYSQGYIGPIWAKTLERDLFCMVSNETTMSVLETLTIENQEPGVYLDTVAIGQTYNLKLSHLKALNFKGFKFRSFHAVQWLCKDLENVNITFTDCAFHILGVAVFSDMFKGQGKKAKSLTFEGCLKVTYGSQSGKADDRWYVLPAHPPPEDEHHKRVHSEDVEIYMLHGLDLSGLPIGDPRTGSDKGVGNMTAGWLEE
ncbi:hypothetical protein P280DRAFT_517201 [Massarina eburnea CBS 473.64]|uniref:F-box domain-containing protein n=1 Tax=Massarina eburnea CBS 473.64 TaxID=1395130 RepID=A0A6A6S4Y5_9PLEO|nr:hypothetical protein P280DRAFT_517201 [Massarina eburnea CBS 473.64]